VTHHGVDQGLTNQALHMARQWFDLPQVCVCVCVYVCMYVYVRVRVCVGTSVGVLVSDSRQPLRAAFAPFTHPWTESSRPSRLMLGRAAILVS
jgi:hypothetical protein